MPEPVTIRLRFSTHTDPLVDSTCTVPLGTPIMGV